MARISDAEKFALCRGLVVRFSWWSNISSWAFHGLLPRIIQEEIYLRIIGIDPGYAIVGYGVLDYSHGKFSVVGYGAVTTSADMEFPARLKAIYLDITQILEKYQPDEMGIEKLFFNTNEKTAIDVAQARGVTVLPAILRGIPIYEYTPLQVKSSIVGYGRAEKKQVQEMTRSMLHLKSIIKPDDTADAVAIAITHGLSVTTRKIMDRNTKY
jgi:crossover junction endodeoxyribonuclease RuvC